MVRQAARLLLSCALLAVAPQALAAEDQLDAKPVKGEKTAASSTPLASQNTLQATVTAALHSPNAEGQTLSAMSPATTIRFVLQDANGAREVTLVDARTNQVTRRWMIDGSTTPAALALISETVLSDMGLSEDVSTSNKPLASKESNAK